MTRTAKAKKKTIMHTWHYSSYRSPTYIVKQPKSGYVDVL